jgi:V/A-type H+-transporting ATPase subunit D
MAEPLRGQSATRSAFLELKAERRFVQEGFEFLDEKRMLLAAELLRQLDEYRRVSAEYCRLNGEAVSRLKRAIFRHGLDGLTVYPPLLLENPRVELEQRAFLGVALQQVQALLAGSAQGWAAANPSPEANACAAAFQQLLGIAAQLATISGNLHRLCGEYARTQHRARALENIIIPEFDTKLKMIDEQLETIEQEDVLRVRFRR